jgi:hypothetical protein
MNYTGATVALESFDESHIPMYVEHLVQKGYLHLSNVVEEGLIASCVKEVSDSFSIPGLLTANVEGRFINTSDFAPNRASLAQGWRVINAEQHVACIRDIIFHPRTMQIMKEFYSRHVQLIQTLYYEYGSGQMTHSDYPNVTPPCAEGFDHSSLVGSTVYFEKSTVDNGALYTFPGTHRDRRLQKLDWNDFPGNGRDDKVRTMHEFINKTVEENYKRKVITARRGDLILWMADLIHGGSHLPPGSEKPFRRSIICHYGNVNSYEHVGQPSSKQTCTRRIHGQGMWFENP